MAATHAGTHGYLEAERSFSFSSTVSKSHFQSSMDANLTFNPSHQPPGRLTRVYNPQEREVIDQFKDQYMDAKSPNARKTIATVYILPAIFSHWASLGKVFNENDLKLKTTVRFKKV